MKVVKRRNHTVQKDGRIIIFLLRFQNLNKMTGKTVLKNNNAFILKVCNLSGRQLQITTI